MKKKLFTILAIALAVFVVFDLTVSQSGGYIRTLIVRNTSTFHGAATFNAGVTAGSTFNATGATVLSSTLSVADLATFRAGVVDSTTLTVVGVTTLASRLVGSSANFAKIDSFTTTAALDTTVMTGAAVGDVLFVTQYTPAYSTDPDTNVTYHAYVLNTDSVVVARTKNAAANDLKSAGKYFLVRIEK